MYVCWCIPISTTRKNNETPQIPFKIAAGTGKKPKKNNDLGWVQTQIHSNGSAPATSQMGFKTILDFHKALGPVC